MKTLYLLALMVIVCVSAGCEATTVWILRNEPTTDAERIKVAEETSKILSATPHTLSGHDQDWDDAIAMAHRVARETWCRPTLWEYDNRFTGRFKYADEVPVK